MDSPAETPLFAGESNIEVATALTVEEDSARDVKTLKILHWRLALGAVMAVLILAVFAAAMMQPVLVTQPINVGNTSAQLGLAAVGLDCGGPYKQCGGKTWEGQTCCQPGCVCKASGEYFSSCTPLKGANVCDKAAAQVHTKDILDGTPELKGVAIKGCKAKASAALEAAAEFAKAATAMVEAYKAAEAQVGAYENVKKQAAAGEAAFIQAVKDAKSADAAEAATGKTAWQAGDVALKKEAARIKVAMQGDAAFGKLQGTAKDIVAWLGAAKTK